MDEATVGWGGLGLSLILVAIAVAASLWRGLRLERAMLWATGRALAQLLAVGAVLVVVIDEDAPVALAWGWVALMVVVAAVTVRRRAPEVPGVGGLAFVATAASTGLSLAVVFGLGIFPAVGRAIVPIAGMVIGNSLGGTVVAARRIIVELADRRGEVEARLALGQPWQEASRPLVRSAMHTAMIAQIERTNVVGLVALPGAMTGLILAGVDPVDAVLVQAAIMYLILGAVATNVVGIGLGVTRRLFTPDHRLVRLPRQAT